MEKFRLDGRVVIITGAAGLLGKAFSREVARAGGTVILADINSKKGIELEQLINGERGDERATFCQTDITSVVSIKRMITRVLGKFDRIDALVNNAYPRNEKYGRKLEDVTYKDFCENVNLHLGGYFLMTQQVAETMKKQGSGNVVDITSIYGCAAPRFELYAGTNMTVPVEYAATKAALINLTKYFAAYYAKYNIRVNSISPGGVFDHQPESFVRNYEQEVLIEKRMANPDDLTGALLFLLSDSSCYVTGQNLIVDGGWTIR